MRRELLDGAVDVLLVEDSAADVELTLRMLKRSGLGERIAVARDGEEALDFLLGRGPHAERGDGTLPQLVLLDIRLPRVDGFEVLQAIKAHPRTRTTPVVIFASSGDPLDIRRSYQLGANGYVRKPVDFDRFSDVIRQLGHYWLDINEGPQVTALHRR